MNEPEALPWVVFAKADRSRSVVVADATYPNAMRRGAIRLKLQVGEVDYAPVLEGETVEGAKKRVAGAKP